MLPVVMALKQHPDRGGAGVYKNFAQVSDIESFFSRAGRLWSQYHDSGRMEIMGGRPKNNAVVMRLLGFVIPIEGFVRLQRSHRKTEDREGV